MLSKLLALLTPELFVGLFRSKKCLFACLVEAALGWAYVQASAETTVKLALISGFALVAVGYLVPQGLVDIVIARSTGKDPDVEGSTTNVSTTGSVSVTSVSSGGLAVTEASKP